MRQELIINVGQKVETIESDLQIHDLVILGRPEDLRLLYYTIKRPNTVIVDVCVWYCRVLGRERVEENIELVAPVLHSTKLIREVDIS